MKEKDNLEAEVEDLRKQLSYLTKMVESGGNSSNSNNNNSSSGGTSSGKHFFNDGWDILYDKTSDDSSVNLGYSTGITGSTGEIANFPDLTGYNYLKVYFSNSGTHSIHFFDITENYDNNYRFITTNRVVTAIAGMTFTVATKPTKRIVEFGNCTHVEFFANKHSVLTAGAGDITMHIYKIEGKK